jgi:hypothetical protein
MDLTDMSDPKNLNFVVNQVQGSIGMANMPDVINLDLIVNKIQSSLENIPSLNHLRLAVNQAQSSMGLTPKTLGLTNMLDLKNLDLAVSQVQGITSLTNMLDQPSLRKHEFDKHTKSKAFGFNHCLVLRLYV